MAYTEMTEHLEQTTGTQAPVYILRSIIAILMYTADEKMAG